MAEAETVTDTDLEEAIHQIFVGYSPIMHDRHRVHIEVKDGHVALKGHVKSPVTRDFLVKNVPLVEGVRSVDASALYDDEAIRREAGQVVPPGVFVTVEYGAVVLSGKLPENMTLETLVAQVGQVSGVHRVLTNMR